MALRYFFYGTLMDTVVLDTVIGRRVPPSDRSGAVIAGFRRVYRAGAWYPILLPDPDGLVDGVLVSGLTPADAARLAAFEGNEYGVAERPVIPARGQGVLAKVFLPAPGVPGSSREWTPGEWRRKHRGEYLRRTRVSSPRGTGWR
jgi:hypothetical protein